MIVFAIAAILVGIVAAIFPARRAAKLDRSRHSSTSNAGRPATPDIRGRP